MVVGVIDCSGFGFGMLGRLGFVRFAALFRRLLLRDASKRRLDATPKLPQDCSIMLISCRHTPPLYIAHAGIDP